MDGAFMRPAAPTWRDPGRAAGRLGLAAANPSGKPGADPARRLTPREGVWGNGLV